MTQKEAIAQLKEKSIQNPALNAALHLFTLRKRARSTLTMNSLIKAMQKEGFEFSKEQYAEVFKALSQAGFGHLDTGAKGRIRGLKDIHVALRSLGLAALGHGSVLKTFKKKTKFSEVLAPVTPPAPPIPAQQEEERSIVLGLKMGDRHLQINIPLDLPPYSVMQLIESLKTLGTAPK